MIHRMLSDNKFTDSPKLQGLLYSHVITLHHTHFALWWRKIESWKRRTEWGNCFWMPSGRASILKSWITLRAAMEMLCYCLTFTCLQPGTGLCRCMKSIGRHFEFSQSPLQQSYYVQYSDRWVMRYAIVSISWLLTSLSHSLLLLNLLRNALCIKRIKWTDNDLMHLYTNRRISINFCIWCLHWNIFSFVIPLFPFPEYKW